jgi:hypothetical protein
MVFIFTENFSFAARCKRLVKKLLGRGIDGPRAVELSLRAGLESLNQPHCFNQKPGETGQTVWVLSGVKTLRWAIRQKRLGKIKRIIAGPNISNAPDDNNKILRDPALDLVVVASPWVGDFYTSQAPELKDKIRIWAAGVTIPSVFGESKSYDFLVYNKTGDSKLFLEILGHLKKSGFKYAVVAYRHFQQAEYFFLLERSKFEIYLSESETQGLAMMEAWARDVPTLVWERGFWQNGANRWEGKTASSYVNAEVGEKFLNFEDFKNKLQVFMSGNYSPRIYAEKKFSNSVVAQNFLKIYNS